MDYVTTSLEALLQRITNSQNKHPDVPGMEAFCVFIIKEPEGVQIGSKLISSYIQISNEKESLQALSLLDVCMDRCGPPFHAEIGKFRFLNEMIRLVSPKYLGNKTPNSVRQKVIQLLHRWIKDYPREMKIKEAYDMLKKQGVIKDDSPPDDVLPLKKPTIFEDEEKSKLLQKLLRSKNPDDLQAANRLIKTMVKEDEKRLKENSQRTMELESVNNNVKLLSEMLDSYDPVSTSAEDLELMRELHQACQRLKPSVVKLATELQANEELIGEVLTAGDELTEIFDKFNRIIVFERDSPSLLDLSSCEEEPREDDCDLMPTDMQVLGDIFNSIDNNAFVSTSSVLQPVNLLRDTTRSKEPEVAKVVEKSGKTKALEQLDQLGESLLKENLAWINDPRPEGANCRSNIKIESLTDIEVRLQDIKPGIHPPRTLIDEKNGITATLHFAKDTPREDVSVIVITTVNKNDKPLENYLFQAMISKNCKCRLQSPSGTGLPGYNPFLPAAAITQIMLIANPNRERVSFKYMLSYTMDDETCTEMGDVPSVPQL